MKILVLGANGFIGSRLCEKILGETNWHITALDLSADKLTSCMQQDRFRLHLGDMLKEKKWVRENIAAADVVLPLVAVATPALYVEDPLRVFELDFEANLEIVRMCVELKKHLVFPSTSEVYGMCPDAEFKEDESVLVTGPIQKERWIYSTSKQLLDRVIHAYGKHHDLKYTLFRPFNWYGPRLDNILNPKRGGSRVLTQFLGNILRGEDIFLVNGGAQKRCFTYLDDGIDAIIKIIANVNNAAHQKIFNIGNPQENISIAELANHLQQNIIQHYPTYADKARNTKIKFIDAKEYYGEGYQDVQLRVPAISHAKQYLNWQPTTDFNTGLRKTLDYYLQE